MTCPTGKFAYPTHSAAQRTLTTIRKRKSRSRHEARAYRCEECHRWHLTSRRKK